MFPFPSQSTHFSTCSPLHRKQNLASLSGPRSALWISSKVVHPFRHKPLFLSSLRDIHESFTFPQMLMMRHSRVSFLVEPLVSTIVCWRCPFRISTEVHLLPISREACIVFVSRWPVCRITPRPSQTVQRTTPRPRQHSQERGGRLKRMGP